MSGGEVASGFGRERKTSDYRVEVGEVLNDTQYVVEHTHIPEDPNKIPTILGLSGPARSGTTALLFLLAGHPNIKRVYYQPQKTVMRGGQDFVLNGDDDLVFMKETFGQFYHQENYDPIELLIKAGVPPKKICWITILRNPLQTFGSWFRSSTPEAFEASQKYALDLYLKYLNTDIKMIPFVYDLLEGRELEVLNRLMERTGLINVFSVLNFDIDAIAKKMVPGQAGDKAFFKLNIEDTLKKQRFVFTRNDYFLESTLAKEVVLRCQERYELFKDIACMELDL